MSPWKKLLVLRSRGTLTPQNIVDWAYTELLAGRDTPNLRILAGLRAPLDLWEAEHYLEATLDDLVWQWEDGTPFWNEYILEIAREVLSGLRSPILASQEIYSLYRDMGYPVELSNWLYITDGLDPDTHEQLDGWHLEAVIRRECQRMVADGLNE